MEVIAVLVLEVFLTEYYKRKKRKRGGQPARSGAPPASLPDMSGSQAGPLGWAAGLSTGLDRLSGRPTRVLLTPPAAPALLPAWAGSQAGPLGWIPGLPTGLGRLPGRPA